MLKTEAVYLPAGSTWTAKNASVIVGEIATDIGVAVEADTLAYIQGHDFLFSDTPKMGMSEGTTDREMLSIIGIALCGNWIINDDNELELVKPNGILLPYCLITHDSQGYSYATQYALIEDADEITTIDSDGLFQVMAFSSCTDSTNVLYVDKSGLFQVDTLANFKALAEEQELVVIGDEVVDFKPSPVETITRVELQADSQTAYRSPSGLTEAQWEALGGFCISVSMPLMASQQMADDILSELNGFTHIPYSATEAYFSPDVKLGRYLKIKDDIVVLENRTLNIDPLASARLDVQAASMLQSLYPYLDPIVKKFSREVVAARTAADNAQTTADGASAREQLIYISVPSGTVPSANTTWVTQSGNVQNAWTTTRPTYSSSYPVLYVARQRQTVAQASGSACTCTTPVIDETTTVIDGGHITTGTIDANVVTVANINASNITTGEMSADRISGGTLTLGGVNYEYGHFVLIGEDGSTVVAEIDGTGLHSSRVEASEYIAVDHWKWYEDPTDNTFNLVYEA